MSFYGIGQNSAYFHRPGEFRPERFMPGPPSEFKNDNHEAYHPFSIGAYNVRTNPAIQLKIMPPCYITSTNDHHPI